jgi:hypothetical protein
MPATRRRRPGPRAVAKEIADHAPEKYFPNGIAATMLAIQYNWHSVVAENGERDLSAPRFCKETRFAETYMAVQALYPSRERITNVTTVVRDNVNQDRNIDFTDMRAFAELLGIPTGLFLLFTQFVSNERHAGENRRAARQEAIDLIEGVRRAIDAAEQYIKTRPIDRPLFIDDGACKEYLADMEVMKLWVDAFNPPP